MCGDRRFDNFVKCLYLSVSQRKKNYVILFYLKTTGIVNLMKY